MEHELRDALAGELGGDLFTQLGGDLGKPREGRGSVDAGVSRQQSKSMANVQVSCEPSSPSPRAHRRSPRQDDDVG